MILISILFATVAYAGQMTPLDLIQKEEAQVIGKTFTSHMKMTIDPEGNSRTLEFKLWMENREKTLLKIIKPEKDKNQGNLKLGIQLWQFLPKIDRIIKIPPSMMLQSWMGSDFTNDDLVKGSFLSKDYTLKYLGMEEVDGFKTYKIEATPKPNAPIVWGKVIEYVAHPSFAPLKREMYDEKGKLIKTMTGTKLKTYNGHTVPSTLTMTNHESHRKTVIEYLETTYDQPIDSKIFSQDHLRKPVF